jgi:ABC-type methionine transport system ATPase subunit
LAALDTQTAKHIVDHCLQGDVLRGRTVILVVRSVPVILMFIFKVVYQTHNLALTSNVAEFVVEVKDGKITQQGSAADVLARDPSLRPRSEEQSENSVTALGIVNGRSSIGEDAPKRVATVLIKKEEISQGRVSRATSMYSYVLGD